MSNNTVKKGMKSGKRKKSGKKDRVGKINSELKRKYKDDLRGPNSSGQSLESVVVNQSIPIVVETDPNKFGAVLLGVISIAISKGWSINTPDDNFIYWAWAYQAELLQQAAKGGIPYTGNIPRWMNYLVQAIIKTTVSSRGGQFSYNFNVEGQFDSSPEQAMGPLVYKNVFSMGVKSGTLVNGLFPIVNPPAAYTVENGQIATQNLWLFLQGHFKNDPMHEMVEFNTKNIMTNDASAFTFFLNNPGGGQADGGAWFKNLYLEVGIRAPLFSVFSNLQAKPFVNRAAVKLRLGSCDGVTLGAMLINGMSKNHLRMTNPIRPVFIDFLEFVNVYALACSKAILLRTQTAAFIENVTNDPNYFVDYVQCPLTLQEFTLMIRASLMLVFTDTMKLQGIYPRVPINGTDREFVTLNCGIQTAPIPMGNMMLFPSIMKENILALRSRLIGASTSNPIMYMSCLGMYHGDKLNLSDYDVTYNIGGVDVTSNIFQVVPLEKEIDPVDGQTGTEIVAINEVAAITQLTEVFNQWIQQMGDHFRKLDVLNVDDGNDALSMIGLYSHWADLGREAEALGKKNLNVAEKKKEDDVPKTRFSRFRVGTYKRKTIYHERSLLAYTSAYEVFSSLWSNLQQFWVTGINLVDAPTVQFGDNTGFNRVAALMGETRQIDVGTGSTVFTTLGDRHDNYSNLVVKTKFAFTTNQEALLEDINNKGNSGILGKLTSTLIGEVGKAGIDVAADALGSLIPV